MENEKCLVPLAFAPVNIPAAHGATLLAKCPTTLVFQPERLVVLVSAFSYDGHVLLHRFAVAGTQVLPLGLDADTPDAERLAKGEEPSVPIPLSDGLIAEGGSLRLPPMPVMHSKRPAELTLYNLHGGTTIRPQAYLLGRPV